MNLLTFNSKDVRSIHYNLIDKNSQNYFVAHCHKGYLCMHLSTIDEGIQYLKNEFPDADVQQDSSIKLPTNNSIFLSNASEFQKTVWRELVDIEEGSTVTYSQLAEKLGKPTSTRAVASAVGKNNFAVLIPCHRVTRKDGSLGGFRWGIDKKKVLLELENR